jgi:hypothetical protein
MLRAGRDAYSKGPQWLLDIQKRKPTAKSTEVKA